MPRLLRELNDRAAFDLLLAEGPLTRTRLGELTGLSKVTAAQMLDRLAARGLVSVVGSTAGTRGPNAALFAIRPSAAYVAGLDAGPEGFTTAIADITGRVLTQETVETEEEPVAAVHTAIGNACKAAGIRPSDLHVVVVGTPGVIDSQTGDVNFSFDLPDWHAGIRSALAADLECAVLIENDVNLAAVAERVHGAARQVDDFALLWAGRGVGLASVIGGRLHRGRGGAAGELGYLPVTGVPPAAEVRHRPGRPPAVSGGLQALVGGDAVRELAFGHGLQGDSAAALVRQAVDGEVWDFVDRLAERLALGVAAVSVILDPGFVVLAGEVCQSGGPELARRVQDAVGRICPVRPDVAVTAVESRPVLLGAVNVAAEEAREGYFRPG